MKKALPEGRAFAFNSEHLLLDFDVDLLLPILDWSEDSEEAVLVLRLCFLGLCLVVQFETARVFRIVFLP